MVRPVLIELGNGGDIGPTYCRFGVSSSQDIKESIYDDDFKSTAFQTKLPRDEKTETLALMFVNEI
jgi:hypothetical protein